MSISKYYIKEIISTQDVTDKLERCTYWQDKPKPIIEVSMVVDCNGLLFTIGDIFSECDWEIIKNKGYYIE